MSTGAKPWLQRVLAPLLTIVIVNHLLDDVVDELKLLLPDEAVEILVATPVHILMEFFVDLGIYYAVMLGFYATVRISIWIIVVTVGLHYLHLATSAASVPWRDAVVFGLTIGILSASSFELTVRASTPDEPDDPDFPDLWRGITLDIFWEKIYLYFNITVLYAACVVVPAIYSIIFLKTAVKPTFGWMLLFAFMPNLGGFCSSRFGSVVQIPQPPLPTAAPAHPVVNLREGTAAAQALLADRQRTWRRFVRYSIRLIMIVAVILVCLALFLL